MSVAAKASAKTTTTTTTKKPAAKKPAAKGSLERRIERDVERVAAAKKPAATTTTETAKKAKDKFWARFSNGLIIHRTSFTNYKFASMQAQADGYLKVMFHATESAANKALESNRLWSEIVVAHCDDEESSKMSEEEVDMLADLQSRFTEEQGQEALKHKVHGTLHLVNFFHSEESFKTFFRNPFQTKEDTMPAAKAATKKTATKLTTTEKKTILANKAAVKAKAHNDMKEQAEEDKFQKECKEFLEGAVATSEMVDISKMTDEEFEAYQDAKNNIVDAQRASMKEEVAKFIEEQPKKAAKTEKVVTLVEKVVNDEVTMVETVAELPVDRQTDVVPQLPQPKEGMTQLEGISVLENCLKVIGEYSDNIFKGIPHELILGQIRKSVLALTDTDGKLTIDIKPKGKRTTISKTDGTSALRRMWADMVSANGGSTRETLFKTGQEKFPKLSDQTLRTQLYMMRNGKNAKGELWAEYNGRKAVEVNGVFTWA